MSGSAASALEEDRPASPAAAKLLTECGTPRKRRLRAPFLFVAMSGSAKSALEEDRPASPAATKPLMERGTPQVGPAPVDWGQPSIFRSSTRAGLGRVRGVAPKNKGLTPSAASGERQLRASRRRTDPEHGS